MLDWLDAFLISGLFGVVQIIGLGLLVHLQMGLTRVANFGVAGFWGLGLYVFGILYGKVDWPFGDPWQFLICAVAATAASALAGLFVAWLISDLDVDGALVGTLGFATVIFLLATAWSDLTGGAAGLGGLGFPYDAGPAKTNEFIWFVAGFAGGLAGAFFGVASGVTPLIGTRQLLLILLVVLVGGIWDLLGVVWVGAATGIALTAMTLWLGSDLWAQLILIVLFLGLLKTRGGRLTAGSKV